MIYLVPFSLVLGLDNKEAGWVYNWLLRLRPYDNLEGESPAGLGFD